MKAEDHIAAVEKKLGELDAGLAAADRLELRIRVAELRIKLEHHEKLNAFLDQIAPAALRSLGGGFVDPPAPPVRRRPRASHRSA